MANWEQFRLLRQGVQEWNAWRENHPEEDIDLSNIDVRGHNLRLANLRLANLNGAIFHMVNLNDADLSSADLTRSNLTKTDLIGTKLSKANLVGAQIVAELNDADLSGVNLNSATIDLSSLNDANLSGADLRHTSFFRTRLSGADFSAVQIGWTKFMDVDLSQVKGLATLEHKGPSTIGIDTIYRSGGNIPEAFLRGAGIPDTLITYVRSLVGKPIECYSCFISHSSKDQGFAERLYADLQSRNVHCWFDSEDLKIGDKFRLRIDESIRLYDKLLLILSEHSIASPWVEKEVETAFEKEHKSGKLVLFPVKLDNTVMETDQAWAADIRRMRHIGDFTRWKEHDEYQKGLSRLLRDLKNSEVRDNSTKE